MHEPTPPTLNEHGDEVHPAFGNITVNRSSVVGGPHNGAVLFDSEIAHRETITVKISPATRSRDLNHDWIHATGKPLVEVEMSMAQWASFVSSMNSGSGVPCTIRKTETEWDVPGLEFAPRLALSAQETRSAAERAFSDIKDALAEVEEVIDSKAGVKALRSAIGTLRARINNAVPNVDFATKSLRKHTEDVMQKARADVEAMVTQHAISLGIDPAAASKAIGMGPSLPEAEAIEAAPNGQ